MERRYGCAVAYRRAYVRNPRGRCSVKAYNTPQQVKVVLKLRSPPEARALQEMLGDNAELFYGVQPPYAAGPTGAKIQLVYYGYYSNVSRGNRHK